MKWLYVLVTFHLPTNLIRWLIEYLNHISFVVFQKVVNCGVQPTILQQLTSLPFAYYSNPQLTNILFPTLIACCYENDFNFSTLEVEVSGNNLVTFLQVGFFAFYFSLLV